jgi:hypothetical protein
VYACGVWLVAFFTNRQLSWLGGWKFAGAAQMAGALFMSLAMAAYGFGVCDLAQLGLAGAFHFVITWIYLIGGLVLLPRDPGAVVEKKNPFA